MSVHTAAELTPDQDNYWVNTAAQKDLDKEKYRPAEKVAFLNQEIPWKWTDLIQQWISFDTGRNEQ